MQQPETVNYITMESVINTDGLMSLLPECLSFLRESPKKHNTILIFDEITFIVREVFIAVLKK